MRKGVKIPMPLGFTPPEEAFQEDGALAAIKYRIKDDKIEIYELDGFRVEPEKKRGITDVFREAAQLPMSEEEKLMNGGGLDASDNF